MVRQLVHRFSLILPCLLLLGVSGVFVYQISPLRDPSFRPDGANAGTLVPWLQNVSEETWKLVAAILAVMLATMITFMLQPVSQRSATDSVVRRQRGLRRGLRRFDALWSSIWIVFFSLCWFASIAYLLSQWIID